MKPTINENDVILVKKCDINEINLKDVITFKKEEQIITHRVVNLRQEDGTTKFITKGDNNEINDDFIVEYTEIYGKQLFKIPKIGVIIEYIQKTNGIINLTILILIIFIFIGLKDKKKNIRRTKRRKYEIKKLRDNYN